MATHQEELRFDEAEAGFHERLNMVNLALQRIEADIYLCRLLERVFHLTQGGVAGQAVLKSHDELASRPLWLCCSKSKARSTVGAARHYGLLVVEENRYASTGQRANSYSIDWEGIRRILHGGSDGSQGRPRRSDRNASGEAQGGASRKHPPALPRHGPASTEQGPALLEHPSGDLFLISKRSPVPGPAPDRETVPGVFLRHPELRLVPELAEAGDREVAPRPVGKLAYGAFAAIEERHLRRAWSLMQWHAQQLSLPAPIVGASLAEMILVVAAGLYAIKLPHAEVRKSRVAVFCDVVSRQRWRRVLRHVPAAAEAVRSLLADSLTTHPSPLTPPCPTST